MQQLGAMALSVLLGSALLPGNSYVSAQDRAPQPQPEKRAIVIPRVTRPPQLEDYLRQSVSTVAVHDAVVAAHDSVIALHDIGVLKESPVRSRTREPLGRPVTPTGGPIGSPVKPDSSDGSPVKPTRDSIAGSPATSLGVMVKDFRQYEPGDGTAVSQETIAYLSYDDENLYVVFVCRDERDEIRSSIARREDIEADDAVVLYLDTFNDRKRAYQFIVNPHGVQLDGIVTEGQDDDLSFDAVWQSEGRLTDSGYIVRMEIPFRSLRFARGSNQTWGLALGRLIRRENEESYWPYITEREQGFVPQFATAEGLSDISPGRNIQVNPYATMARARVLEDEAEVPGFRTLDDQRVGLDAKVVLLDALTLDGTVNPDFSQVETDDPQVSVNQRFEVFFPEKRPFFLENAGYFQTPVNLFFSRRIQDPGGGLRLTGKVGRLAIGAIGMNDRSPEEVAAGDAPADRNARVGAVRVQREIGEESTVGLLVTDRTLANSFNRIVSLDGRLRFGEAWAFAGQIIRSENRDFASVRQGGFGGVAELERDGRNFDYTASYLHFDSTFDAPLGFVQRVGIRQTEHELLYEWLPEGDAVVSFGPGVWVLYNWDPSRVLLDREIGAFFQVELVGETQLQVEHARLFERFEDLPFRPHYTYLSLGTAWLKWLALDASYEWGTAVNHDPAEDETTGEPLPPSLLRAREAEVQLAFRLIPALRWGVAFVHGNLKTNEGRRVAREFELRSKLNYQFNRFLSLRAIVDHGAEDADPALYDSDERDREWNFDVLMTYLVRPGTAVHVGFTDRYQNLELARGTSPAVERTRSATTSTGRQFFVKLSYLLRF